jgi:hypothetical protein
VIERQLVPYYAEMLNLTTDMLGVFVANDFMAVRLFDIDGDTLQMIRERIPALGRAILNLVLAATFFAVFPLLGRGKPDLDERLQKID